MMGLTAKQRELYDFIAATVAEKGVAPSFEEMAAAIGTPSKGEIYRILEILEHRGVIRRGRGARAIELIRASVTLNHEILSLTDRYAKEHGISRDTAANELLRQALGAAA